MAPKVKTPQEVMEGLIANGKTIKEFANEVGCEYKVVHALLSGLSIGRRGKAHKAAIAIGIKKAA